MEDSDEDEGHVNHQSSEASRIVTLVVAFLLKFQIAYKISGNAIVILLRFFKYLLFVIGKSFGIEALQQDLKIPQSIHGCCSQSGITHKPFKEFVVCPTCHTLFDPAVTELVEGTSTNRRSAQCKYVQFPHHPQERFRSACNTVLMNTVKRTRNRIDFKPRKVYCYYGIKLALSNLLENPDFLKDCNSWKERLAADDMMSDIIDGKVWQEEMRKLEGRDCNLSNVLGFLLNIDWLKPFKHVSYSVGVIYAVILNLPRCTRYKDSNVIIVGVIPGPNEPPHDINSYLGPMVTELLELYAGVWFKTPYGRRFIRGVLLCFSSDIPATRKAAGFVGHNSIKGCSRCLKTFTTNSGNTTDYSGYNRDSWAKRTNETHRHYAYKELTAKTKAEKRVVKQTYGARYSVLFELPYYDCIRFVVIDVMHNLFIGTSKHVINVWKEKELLKTKDFWEIQKRVKNISVPQDIGRIPYKIDSGMAGMTADQWKNWTCIYSLYALQGLIPKEHLDCWWLFVQACIILCQPIISQSDIDRGDRFLVEFCQRFQTLYGQECCTPNMHLHCHVADCLRDYGPAHSTWCFSFERCNGILGSMPNNNKSLDIEKTMIKQFILQMEYSNCIASQCTHNLLSFFPEVLRGSLSEPISRVSFVELRNLSKPVPTSDVTYSNSVVTPIGQLTEHAMNGDMVQSLTNMYEVLFRGCSIIHTTSLCQRFFKVKIGDKVYSSKLARSDRSSFVCAYWLKDDDGSIDTSLSCRPGCVQYYMKHNVQLQRNNEQLIEKMYIAVVKWFKQHPEKTHFHPPNTVWDPDYVPLSEASFIPISRIASRCMHVEHFLSSPDRPHNNEKVVVMCPVSGPSFCDMM